MIGIHTNVPCHKILMHRCPLLRKQPRLIRLYSLGTDGVDKTSTIPSPTLTFPFTRWSIPFFPLFGISGNGRSSAHAYAACGYLGSKVKWALCGWAWPSVFPGTERNGTERNGTERNGTERSGPETPPYSTERTKGQSTARTTTS